MPDIGGRESRVKGLAERAMPPAVEGVWTPNGRADHLPLRRAPHNLEAEQALLGAILVNNEAHDRVSGFLEPQHFFDPLHQQIYETAATLIGAGKQATPITLKTFFENAEPISPSAAATVVLLVAVLVVSIPAIIQRTAGAK